MKLKQRGAFIFILVILFLFKLCFHVTQKESKSKKSEEDDNNESARSSKLSNAFPLHLNSSKHKKNIEIKSDLNRLYLNLEEHSFLNNNDVFEIASNWVNERQIYPFHHKEMSLILSRMANAKIVHADALPKGTQIKLLLVLEGGQKVVFKQKRYERDFIIQGKPYDGYDRHNAEIASFHLDRLLNFRRSPLVVGRKLNLKEEIMPVATDRLLKTFREKDGNICYFGICLYCNEKHMACGEGVMMEGTLTLWLPNQWSKFDKHRHPYQRTYREGASALWEKDETYCNSVVKKKPPYDYGPRLLDVTDGAVFDFLIGNADRHHYETFKNQGRNAMLIMMDNAKSFGNPYVHEPSIIAPLRQCCLIRNSTLIKLKQLQDGVLSQALEALMNIDPIAPVLHESHIKALDIRLVTILNTVSDCIHKLGYEKVVVNEWKGYT